MANPFTWKEHLGSLGASFAKPGDKDDGTTGEVEPYGPVPPIENPNPDAKITAR